MSDDKRDVEAHGLIGNVNESVVEDDAEVEGHGNFGNVNESVVEDDAEVEGHGTSIQSNETVVEDENEQKLDDLEVSDEQGDAVKGGLSEMGEMESL